MRIRIRQHQYQTNVWYVETARWWSFGWLTREVIFGDEKRALAVAEATRKPNIIELD